MRQLVIWVCHIQQEQAQGFAIIGGIIKGSSRSFTILATLLNTR